MKKTILILLACLLYIPVFSQHQAYDRSNDLIFLLEGSREPYEFRLKGVGLRFEPNRNEFEWWIPLQEVVAVRDEVHQMIFDDIFLNCGDQPARILFQIFEPLHNPSADRSSQVIKGVGQFYCGDQMREVNVELSIYGMSRMLYYNLTIFDSYESFGLTVPEKYRRILNGKMKLVIKDARWRSYFDARN